MNLQLTGTITTILPTVQGTSASGNQWAKQDFVVTTYDQFPRPVCFTLFGQDKIDQFALKQGEQVRVSFDIKSREYKGRWFTDINAWNVERIGQGQYNQPQPYQQPSPMEAQQQQTQQQMRQMQQAGGDPFPQQQNAGQGGGKKDDDLPF